MARRPQSQVSFFDPEFADPGRLEPGSLPWLLARHRRLLFPAWLFAGWKPPGQRGPKGWDGSLLMVLMLLRWSEEGVSRSAAVRRARRGTSWRAALGLPLGGETPSLRTMRRFEAFLQRRHPETGVPHYLLLHEHFVRLCLDKGIARARPVWAMDSTPMWAYGAMLDTVRLMGDGLRTLGRRWAQVTGMTPEAVAGSWQLPLLLSKSTKGAFDLDWRDKEQTAGVIDRIARDVLRIVPRVLAQLSTVRTNKRKGLRRLCRNLLKVVRDDLEADEHGRLVVAREVARGRLVSITDPQARLSRNSRSASFKGFKIHVLGDVVSGLLLSLAVTPGGMHDSAPAHRLVHRARKPCAGLDRVLADTACGAARLRHIISGAEKVELLAPPPPVNDKPNSIGRKDMEIDLASGLATCPGKATVEMSWSWSGLDNVHVRKAVWPRQTCGGCQLRQQCSASTRNGQGRSVRLHPYEAELVAAREAWEQPEVRAAYRTRSQCDRLVNQVVRHGGRQARAWGLRAARVQAHLSAMRCNLGLLAQALAQREEVGQDRAA